MSLYQIDRKSGEAVYRQISRLLAQEVQNNYEPGDSLPAEHELADRFSVNRHTVRRAVDELIAMGMVERLHGKGIFVLSPTVDYSIHGGTRFTENLEQMGMTTSSRVLRMLVIPARGGVARRLALKEEAPVIWIETLRSVDESPFCLISHFLPREGLEAVANNYTGGSLHTFLNSMGIQLRRQESLISAVLPQGEDALLLQMPRTAPVLRVKSVNVDVASGKTVEYAVTRFRADKAQLSVNP